MAAAIRVLLLGLYSESRLQPSASKSYGCDAAQTELHIAMVGKYNGLSDAYLSVIKALQHACLKCKSRLKVGRLGALVPVPDQ